MLQRETGLCLKLLQKLAEPCAELAEEWRSVPALITDLDIQRSHGTKLVQRLSKLGFVETRRGKGGGVRLCEAKRSSTLKEVATQLGDPFVRNNHCLMEGRPCNAQNHCPVHKSWKNQHKSLLELLERPFLELDAPVNDA